MMLLLYASLLHHHSQAKELGEMLKGCSLYVIGNGAKKSAVGSILAKRLSKYRFYDVPALVCSTYTAVSECDSTCSARGIRGVRRWWLTRAARLRGAFRPDDAGGKTVASMGKMCEAEPLDDVAKLNSAVMSQVQAYARSVITVWEGAVETSDFAIMQQGLVINLDEAPNVRPSRLSRMHARGDAQEREVGRE
eukprot:6214570-Pleurochrysis_carterae.AAC.3